MTRPKITLEELMQKFGDLIKPIPEKVLVVAIRGYYRDSMGMVGQNDRNIYDDAMIVISTNFYATFNANTDPSKFKNGVAKLVPGLHYFKKGKHHIGTSKAYDAFRPATQDESLPVVRDGQVGTSKGIAINIHKGGLYTTGSEGCQTIISDQWDEFQKTVYNLMTQNNQTRLPYLLVENI